jgi:branched-chain amino acid aminotransferase
VFVVRGGVLATPPASAGCLMGVTRALLLELARDAGLAAQEVDLAVDALVEGDEAFLSSTTREVQPIAHVDGRPLRSVVGQVSMQLGNAFRELVARDLDP